MRLSSAVIVVIIVITISALSACSSRSYAINDVLADPISTTNDDTRSVHLLRLIFLKSNLSNKRLSLSVHLLRMMLLKSHLCNKRLSRQQLADSAAALKVG